MCEEKKSTPVPCAGTEQYFQDGNPRLVVTTNADEALKKICLEAANDAVFGIRRAG